MITQFRLQKCMNSENLYYCQYFAWSNWFSIVEIGSSRGGMKIPKFNVFFKLWKFSKYFLTSVWLFKWRIQLVYLYGLNLFHTEIRTYRVKNSRRIVSRDFLLSMSTPLLNRVVHLKTDFKLNLQFIVTTTECLTGVDILLFWASHVSKIPSSDLLSPVNITLEVTVDPEDTSEAEAKGRPDQNHFTWGLGRPETKVFFAVLYYIDSMELYHIVSSLVYDRYWYWSR